MGGDLAAGAQCASVQKWTIDGSSAVWLIFKLLSHPPMHMVQNIDRSDDDSHHVGPLLERSPTIDRGHGMGGTWDMRHVGPINAPPDADPPPSVISKFTLEYVLTELSSSPYASHRFRQPPTGLQPKSVDPLMDGEFSVSNLGSAHLFPGSSARNPPSKSVNFGRFACRRAQCARCTLEYRSRNLGRSRRV